jgi:hypothetical protein
MISYNPGLTVRQDNIHVLIDADCVAYWGAAGCDGQALRTATRRIDERMNQILDECRAGEYTGYLTGKDNFRDGIATLQRYKGNRYDAMGKRIKEQPQWLTECRTYLEDEWDCIMVQRQEADDALSIHRANVTDDSEYIISSIDKDLMINNGKHHDMNSGEFTDVEGFGDIWMKGSACKGFGLKFFYTQMLMGDSADWIKGLPKITEYMVERYGNRRGGCGAKGAWMVMKDVTTEEEACQAVWECYYSYWKDNGYCHWLNTKEKYEPGYNTAVKQFIEQGRLLWMRQEQGELWLPKYPLLEPKES